MRGWDVYGGRAFLSDKCLDLSSRQVLNGIGLVIFAESSPRIRPHTYFAMGSMVN